MPTFYLALYCILVGLGQQQPPRTCINTGLTCIESCAGLADGNYQWCGSCQWFIQCSGEVAYYQPCNANLYWHDDVKACVSVSDTCSECVIHTSPNGFTDSTIRMTTLIGRRTHKSNNSIHNSSIMMRIIMRATPIMLGVEITCYLVIILYNSSSSFLFRPAFTRCLHFPLSRIESRAILRTMSLSANLCLTVSIYVFVCLPPLCYPST